MLRDNLGLCRSFFKVDLNDCKRLHAIMVFWLLHSIPSLWESCYPSRPLRTWLSPSLSSNRRTLFKALGNQITTFCHARLSLMRTIFTYIYVCIGDMQHRHLLCIQLILVPIISQTLEDVFWILLYLLPGHKVVFESSGGKKPKWQQKQRKYHLLWLRKWPISNNYSFFQFILIFSPFIVPRGQKMLACIPLSFFFF